MFESAAPFHSPEPPAGGVLRELDWNEIVARLGAARDLRALFTRPMPQGGGFMPQTAAGISEREAGEPGVNFAGLSHGKWADATTAAAAFSADHGDRDK